MNELQTIGIIAETLSVTLTKTEKGILLSGIEDLKTGKKYLSSSHSLFELVARSVSDDTTVTLDSAEGWASCSFQQVSGDTVILLTNNEKLPGVSVVICAHAAGKRIEWSVRLISENNAYSLYECDWPAVTLDSDKDVMFLSPTGPGEVWNTTDECSSKQNYPSYGASMQFMAFWDNLNRRGVYYGIHDASPAYKKIFFRKKANENTFNFKILQPLTDIDVGCNSQTLYGVCVWEIFDGDWYDASLIYRDFFIKNAQWMPDIDENGRKDEPDWMKQVAHWWRVRMKDDEEYVDLILKANKDLGYDSPVHLYDWFKIPYDNDYPHYFPAKEAFYTGVKRLQENGVKVMPYINARLWDTRDKGTEDFEWSSKAKPNCTKNRKGEPFIEVYNSKEADGSSVRHSIMCPSTACWQEKITSLVDELLNKAKVNAVYMDQIAAAQPYPCEDRTHNHRPGGGSWWAESYNNLLDHACRVRPEGTGFTTECTADPFMKHMQGYLTWVWVHNRQVPAFVAIYSRYVTMFGRNYCFMPFDDDEGQRINIAQSLTFGEQLGWNDPELYLQMKNKDFYRKCVHEREKIGSYMYNGTLLRSPSFTDDGKIIKTTHCREAYGGVIEHSAAFIEHWERADGEKMLILVNASEKEVNVKITYGLDDGEYNLSGDSAGVLKVVSGKAEVKLPPLSVSYSFHK